MWLHAQAAPEFWRRARFPAKFNVAQLCRLLQCLFGWKDQAGHQIFLRPGLLFATEDEQEYDFEGLPWEEDLGAHDLLTDGCAFRYRDLGRKGWLTVHIGLEPDSSAPSPWCLDGQGFFQADTVNHALRVAFRSRLAKARLERDPAAPPPPIEKLF